MEKKLIALFLTLILVLAVVSVQADPDAPPDLQETLQDLEFEFEFSTLALFQATDATSLKYETPSLHPDSALSQVCLKVSTPAMPSRDGHYSSPEYFPTNLSSVNLFPWPIYREMDWSEL